MDGIGGGLYRGRHRQGVPSGPAQVRTCEVGSRPVPGGGSRLSLEKARTQRVAGGCPPPPLFFIARSFPLARFGVVGRSGTVVELVRSPGTCPDLDSHFAGAGFGGESISWRECSTYEGFSPRGRLWVGKPSFRVSDTCRPTDSPGRAHPAGPGSSPQKGPKGLTHLSVHPPPRPVGHASQSSAGRSRRKRMQSCFDRLRRPKHTSHPESAGFAGAVRGASPNFGRGLTPSRISDTPVHCPPERSSVPACPSQNSPAEVF